MTLDIEPRMKRIATYERVSSDDQKLRETIKTQTEQIAYTLQCTTGVSLVNRYVDDGVSGTIPMAKRGGGRKLMEDAPKHIFDEVWVWKIDRLGRDDIDPLVVWKELETYGIKVHSVTEGVSDIFSYHILVAVAAQERRNFMARSAAGTERAVKEGRFPGGICPLGYEIKGRKHDAKIIPSERIIWQGWTAADLISNIYELLSVEHWSCPRIAEHLNALGVPTAYQHFAPGPRRAERKTGLQAKWRAGRICNLVKSTVYKGVYQYGKRSKKKDREVWEVPVTPLVSVELWQAAQEALNRNRVIAKNTPRHYLLTGLMKCGECGKTYCASHDARGAEWWKCNGKMTSRYDAENRCNSKMVNGKDILPIVWNDIESWLRNPGEMLRELEDEQDQGKEIAVRQSEIATLEISLESLERERKGYLRQNAQGLLSDVELGEFLKEISEKKTAIENRVQELVPELAVPETIAPDLLQELRRRLDKGMTDEQRQEIARLLVKQITIRTKDDEEGRRCVAEVEYRFIAAVNSCTDRGSWLR